MPAEIAMIIAAASELAKLSLSSYFQYARMSGMTEEQIEQNYQAEKARFKANAPDTLPPPPETGGGE